MSCFLFSFGFAAFGAEPGRPEVVLDPFEVTGSLIKRVEQEGPAPVKIISRAEIEESARTSFSEIMMELPEAGYSQINESATADAPVKGAAALNLRGFGPGNTLILVEGRRAVMTGVGWVGLTFVDTNRYPLSMIERVEILQDSGAIYGSGAAAGVVNIILRKHYQGGELTLSYGNSPRTDVAERSIAYSGGASYKRTQLAVGFEHFSRNALRGDDSAFSASADLTDRYAAQGPEYGAKIAAGYFDLRSQVGPFARVWAVAGQRNGVNGVSIPGLAPGALITGLPGTVGIGATGSANAATPGSANPVLAGSGGRFNAAIAGTFVPQDLRPHSASPNLFNPQPYVWLTPEVERTGINLSLQTALSPQAIVYARFG